MIYLKQGVSSKIQGEGGPTDVYIYIHVISAAIVVNCLDIMISIIILILSILRLDAQKGVQKERVISIAKPPRKHKSKFSGF